MTTKTVELYTFDELSDEAKERARQWWRDTDPIYKGIDDEYTYRMTDESVDDSIKANEYTFTKDGRRN